MLSEFKEYLKFIRLPFAGGMALPLIFGAISVNQYSLIAVIPLFFIGVLSGFYGFVLNDYFDIEVDKLCKDLSERSLVKGTVSKKSARFIILFCFVGAYILVFLFFYRNHILFYTGLSVLILADILGGVYNLYGKRFIGSDFLIALAQSLYFLFAAIIVSKSDTLSNLTWVLFILVFTQLLYNNIFVGGIKDADHDYLKDVHNIALSAGVKIRGDKSFIPSFFKIFAISFRSVSMFFVFVPFIFFNLKYYIWQILLLIILVLILLFSNFKLIYMKKFDRKKLRMQVTLQIFLWYCIISFMLSSIIGFFYSLILIGIPTVWYFLFSRLIGVKSFEPNV